MKFLLFQGLFIAILLKNFTSASNSSSSSGLYDSNDLVVKISSLNFNETILEQNRSVLVEFYNSYCGHCQRFAPKYKALAADLHPWRDVIIISALDCSVNKNVPICSEYEVWSYPSLRYIKPLFRPKKGDVGENIATQNVDEIRELLAQKIAEEKVPEYNEVWPNFQPITLEEIELLRNGRNGPNSHSKRDYTVIVREPENSTIGIESALYLLPWPTLEVRRIKDVAVPAIISKTPINIIDTKGHIESLTPNNLTSRAYVDVIEDFFMARDLTPLPTSTEQSLETIENIKTAQMINEYIKEVREKRHLVYQADLEMGIRNILQNEILKKGAIEGEALNALKSFLVVLDRYNPLNPIGLDVVKQIKIKVEQYAKAMPSKDLESVIHNLSELPYYSAEMYVGCVGSKSYLRGFTCSLWQLFHYMTVQATLRNDTNVDVNEVLKAIHGYVSHFFGCTDCVEHFKAMAVELKIFNVSSKDEAVLWLWTAHNNVNNRLAGDKTEDPEFPKIQFPSRESCPQCHREAGAGAGAQFTNSTPKWNEDAVLEFLKSIHSREHISNYGIENNLFPLPRTEKVLGKDNSLSMGGFFSNMDLGFGLLLWCCCIFIIMVAFNLFVFKGGYRKRSPSRERDILSRV